MGAPTPPPGYYPPPPPPGYASQEEKYWAMGAHGGGIFFGFLAPLVVLLVKGSESPTLRAHAIEALNFQITWGAATILTTIITICASVVTFGFGSVLIILPMACGLVIVIFSILALVKANEGTVYTYPVTLRLVK
jgi:uncharacterized Tic20 family protein